MATDPLKGRYIAPAISAFPPSMVVKPECKPVSLRTETVYKAEPNPRASQHNMTKPIQISGGW
jgi:hypothetical protein